MPGTAYRNQQLINDHSSDGSIYFVLGLDSHILPTRYDLAPESASLNTHQLPGIYAPVRSPRGPIQPRFFRYSSDRFLSCCSSMTGLYRTGYGSCKGKPNWSQPCWARRRKNRSSTAVNKRSTLRGYISTGTLSISCTSTLSNLVWVFPFCRRCSHCSKCEISCLQYTMGGGCRGKWNRCTSGAVPGAPANYRKQPHRA